MAPLYGEYFNYHCIGGYRSSPRAVEIVLSQYLVRKNKNCLANISENWCCDASAHCNKIIFFFCLKNCSLILIIIMDSLFNALLTAPHGNYMIHYLMHYSQLRMVWKKSTSFLKIIF